MLQQASTMSLPFAFLPRQLSRPTKPQGSEPPKTSSLSAHHASPPAPPSDSEDDSKAPEGVVVTKDAKGKGRALEPQSHAQDAAGKDIATLVLLALSDHRIWSDADLRRKLDDCLRCDDASTAGCTCVLLPIPSTGHDSLNHP